jgi:hypothetical protein
MQKYQATFDEVTGRIAALLDRGIGADEIYKALTDLRMKQASSYLRDPPAPPDNGISQYREMMQWLDELGKKHTQDRAA